MIFINLLKKWLIAGVVCMGGVVYSVDAVVNPQFLVDGPVKLGKIGTENAHIFSYGFMKSTWFSEFEVSIYVKPGLSESQWYEIAAKVLRESVYAVEKTRYSLDAYLCPRNPCFYKVYLSEYHSFDERPLNKRDCLFIERGMLERVKGRDICNDEEKAALNGRIMGVVWKKPVEEALADTGVDLSFLRRDPNIVYQVSDDSIVRDIAIREIKRINDLFRERAYSTLGYRLEDTALRNKGELREWFFEYSRHKGEDLGWFKRVPFNVEELKRHWLEQAKIILNELNASELLQPYRTAPWNIRSLKLNLLDRYSKKYVNQTAFVGWSHMVFEHARYTGSGGIADHQVVRIPLEEFYAWAEEEIEKI